MEVREQAEYPLLESLLRIEGVTLQGIYTVAEVASLLSISKRTAYSWIADGKLRGRKFPGGNRFLPSDIEGFLFDSGG